MKQAIVLSGGGSKGSYQMGVWKALRKLHIKYDIVTGTSVGALNGALMTQKTYFKAMWFWSHLGFHNVFDEPIKNDYFTKEGRKEIIKTYAKAVILNNGMDVKRLENNVEHILNVRKLKKSKIAFAFITFNLSAMKPVAVKKEEVEDKMVKDYLIASSTCFPAFKTKKIDGSSYIDGGYYDNLPINLAIEMGATDIIAIDLKEIGLTKIPKDKTVNVTYIRPRNNLGSFLVFNRDLARRGIKLGYNDTMKTFDRLDGNKYTFKHHHLVKNYDKYKHQYTEIYNQFFIEKDKNVFTKILKAINYRKNVSLKDMISTIDFLCETFALDDTKIYSIWKTNHLFLNRTLDESIKTSNVKGKIKKNKLIDSKVLIKYIYECLKENKLDELSDLALLMPKEVMGAIYLKAIS